jgi:fucose permease
METTSASAQPLKGAPQFMTIGIIGVMLFIFGFVTWLNGPLITLVKLAFTLSDVETFLALMVPAISISCSLLLWAPKQASERSPDNEADYVLYWH